MTPTTDSWEATQQRVLARVRELETFDPVHHFLFHRDVPPPHPLRPHEAAVLGFMGWSEDDLERLLQHGKDLR